MHAPRGPRQTKNETAFSTQLIVGVINTSKKNRESEINDV